MEIEHRSIKYNPIYKKIYHLHKGMMDRCYLQSCSSYKNYGAKGITVHPDWHDKESFIATVDKVEGFDLEKLMKGELHLDKDIKFKGNTVYSKDNCTFVSPSDNQGNRPSDICEFVAVSEDGEITYHTNREKFCRGHDLDTSTVWKMLNNNLPSDQRKKGIPYFYKGWQFFYQDEFNNSMIKHKRIIKATFIETGETVEFTEMKTFADKYSINPSLIGACLRGDQKKTKGWKFEIVREANY